MGMDKNMVPSFGFCFEYWVFVLLAFAGSGIHLYGLYYGMCKLVVLATLFETVWTNVAFCMGNTYWQIYGFSMVAGNCIDGVAVSLIY